MTTFTRFARSTAETARSVATASSWEATKGTAVTAIAETPRVFWAVKAVITLAPLLGLLGTVTGMMGSFSMIGGEVGAPAGITGGIAEALIATAFGLCIAIATLIPFNYLNTCVEQLESEMLAAGNQLRLLVEGSKAPAPQELVGGC